MSQRQRKRLSDAEDEAKGAYFLAPSSSYTFINSGAEVLNCVLGGGWPLSRVSNIIGDRSTGKTLLAVEAMANFVAAFPDCHPRYAESEAAFDEEYAAALGIPVDRIWRPDPPIVTVEEFYKDVEDYISEDQEAGLYILDSLDALSDAAEQKREIDKDSMGMGKAKKMSEAFRKMTRKIEASNIHLMIISQTRQKINVMFGRSYTRGGGNALDFYASQILYLAHLGEKTRTVNKIKRATGIDIRVKCTKNKVGLPFRKCEFPILFGYGIEDVCASVDWLLEHKQTKRTGLTIKELELIRKAALDSNLDDVDEIRETLAEHVQEGWAEVEKSFLPTRRKYRND